MQWFRHDDNARNDVKLKALVDEFGLAGETVWWRLLEVRNQAGGDIEVTTDELAAEMSLRPQHRFPLERWLTKCSKLGLIRMRRARFGRRSIAILKWDKKRPKWETKEGAAERQRRSRARRSHESHSDNPVTSQTTDRQTDVEGLGVDSSTQQQQRDGHSDTAAAVIEELTSNGVDAPIALELVSEDLAECRRQLGWIDRRSTAKNRAGLLVSAIRGHYPEPFTVGANGGREYPDFTGSGQREAMA